MLTRALRKGEKRITEIAEHYPVSLNAVSKHLKILERAGLIRREVLGREHWCTLDAAPLKDVKEWASYYEGFWNARLVAMEAALVKRRAAHAAKGRKR